MVSWFAGSGAPFALEAVRRSKSDRKGGHFVTRRSDGRLVLRETAQTPPDEVDASQRHGYSSTNNLWLDIAAATIAAVTIPRRPGNPIDDTNSSTIRFSLSKLLPP